MADEQPVLYIGVVIPYDNKLPILFNDSITNNPNVTAQKTADLVQSHDLQINDDVKLSVIPIDKELLKQLNDQMEANQS